jgi:hypothetical protein
LHVIWAIIDIISAHLKELELDAVSWSSFRRDIMSGEFIEDNNPSRHVLALQAYMQDEQDEQDEQATDGGDNIDSGDVDRLLLSYLIHDIFGFQNTQRFPEIQKLCLSNMPLFQDMASGFNFDTLTSLTLRMCPRSDEFLKHITKSDLPINLTRLEILFASQRPEDDTLQHDETLLDFLKSFTGLEELYIGRAEGVDTVQFFQQVREQHPTLKKLVEHQRSYNYESPDESHDSMDLGILPAASLEKACNILRNLDFVGLTYTPERLFVSTGCCHIKF